MNEPHLPAPEGAPRHQRYWLHAARKQLPLQCELCGTYRDALWGISFAKPQCLIDWEGDRMCLLMWYVCHDCYPDLAAQLALAALQGDDA